MRVRISRVRVHRDYVSEFCRHLAVQTDDISPIRFRADLYLRHDLSVVVADYTHGVPRYVRVEPYTCSPGG